MDDSELLGQVSNSIQQQRNALSAAGEIKPPTFTGGEAIARSFRDRLAKATVATPLTAEEVRRHNERTAYATAQRLAEEANRREAALVASVGRRYATATVESYLATTKAQSEVKADVARYVDRLAENVKAGVGVVLLGPPGTGKDHLAIAILRVAARQGFRVSWVDGMELFASARDNIDADQTEAKWAKRFTEPDMLLISDPVPPVGEVKEGFQIATLFRIVDRRYRDMKPTLITINAENAADAAKRTSANIVDRLSHGSLILNCYWPSYRRSTP